MNNVYLIPVVILKNKNGFSAHSPSFDGCAATGKTIDSTIKRFKSAIEFHLEGEQLVKNSRRKTPKVLKDAFADYGTDAIYATVEIAA
jgi:predicted RNase H-like HicB family nuclease